AALGSAFILAYLASLAVALSVTPTICFALLSRTRPHEEPGYLSRLKAFHRRTLEKVCQRPAAISGLVLALFVGAGVTLPFFGSEFLPSFRKGISCFRFPPPREPRCRRCCGWAGG